MPRRERVVVVHAGARGRLRVRISELYRDEARARAVESELTREPGIERARANPRSATVTIRFGSAISAGQIVAVVGDVLDVVGTNGARSSSGLWHTESSASVCRILSTDLTGLDSSEVTRRRGRYGENVIPVPKTRADLQVLVEQLRSAPVALLVVTAALSAVTGGTSDAVAIAAVVVLNATIGFLTERRAERTLVGLEAPDEQPVLLRRSGSEVSVPAAALVPGDVVVLAPGTGVPADLRLVSAIGLAVDESSLTGESLPVEKDALATLPANVPIADRINMVFRGTRVLAGSGVGVAVATGSLSELGRIQALSGQLTRPMTPIQRELRHLGGVLALLSGGACVAVFVLGLARGRTFVTMMRTALSLAVAAVPEGLPTVATVTHAIGIGRLRARGILIRQLEAVETLGAVDVVCLDKTGTLTANRMDAAFVVVDGRWLAVSDGGRVDAAGSPEEQGEGSSKATSSLALLGRTLALCSAASLPKNGDTAPLSPTELALLQAATALGVDPDRERLAYVHARTRQRDRGRSFMDTLHVGPDAAQVLSVKGSPLDVLDHCARVRLDADERPLGPEERATIEQHNSELAGRGLRVLGVAYASQPDGVESRNLVWLGLVALADPPRPGVDRVLARLHRAGVATIMITGDQSATAAALAVDLGFSTAGGLRVIDASTLGGLSSAELAARCRGVHVFSRVGPADKLKVVQALQATHRVVAMTGDGVNDGPALIAADVGIAMGRSGTATARQMAAVILLEDELERLLVAVEEGRTIHEDIRKAVRFILATNLGEIALTVFQVMFTAEQSLTPLQLLWINLLTDVFPELALAMEPPERDVMAHAPRARGRAMFDDAELKAIGVEGALITGGALAGLLWGRARAPERSNTLAFSTLTCAQLLHALHARSTERTLWASPLVSRNARYVPLSIAAGIGLQIGAALLPGARRLLDLTKLGGRDWGLVASGSLAPLVLNEWLKLRRIRRREAQENLASH